MKISAGSVAMNVPPFEQHRLERADDEIEDVADEDEGDDAADDERDDRCNQPFPELVEMLQERHLAAGFEFVGVGELYVGRVVRITIGVGSGRRARKTD